MTISLTSNKEAVLKKISQNLGIDSQTPGSYIRTLVDGLEEFNLKNVEEINAALNELYLEKASDSTVEKYASKKGISRLKSKNLLVTAEELAISVHPSLYRKTEGLSLTIYNKGEIILEDMYVITFLEDVIYDSDLDRVYVSCMLETNNLYNSLTTKIDSGTSITAKVPTTVSATIKDLTIKINKDLYFSSSTESSDLFRRRVLSAMRANNLSGESHILASINSIPGVDQHYIDKSSYPNKIYIMNNAVYDNFNSEYATRDISIPAGQALLSQVKAYGSNFDLTHAERVSFTLDITLDTTSAEPILKNLSYLKDLIVENHSLGKEYLIGKDIFEVFLKERDINKPYTFSISLYFNGIRIPAPNPEAILIEKHQFPYIEEVTLNGEILNVQDNQE